MRNSMFAILASVAVLSVQVSANACLNPQQLQEAYASIGAQLQNAYDGAQKQIDACIAQSEATKTAALAKLSKGDQTSRAYNAVILKYNADRAACENDFKVAVARDHDAAEEQYQAAFQNACR